jgi:hypothetical protein
MVDQAHKDVDPGVQGVGRLQQAKEIFSISGGHMPDDIDGEQVCPVGLDLSNGRHLFQEIHRRLRLQVMLWNT